MAGGSVTIHGTVGDGPFGSSGSGSGDLDFFAVPDVALGELIVGGTIPELGMATIGIAPSIDPGNFEAGESGASRRRSIPREPGDSVRPADS